MSFKTESGLVACDGFLMAAKTAQGLASVVEIAEIVCIGACHAIKVAEPSLIVGKTHQDNAEVTMRYSLLGLGSKNSAVGFGCFAPKFLLS